MLNPTWVQQENELVTGGNGVPALADDGVSTQAAVTAIVDIELVLATAVSVRVWGIPRRKGGTNWRLMQDTEVSGIATNFMFLVNTSAVERLYVEVVSNDDTVSVYAGLCG